MVCVWVHKCVCGCVWVHIAMVIRLVCVCAWVCVCMCVCVYVCVHIAIVSRLGCVFVCVRMGVCAHRHGQISRLLPCTMEPCPAFEMINSFYNR